MKSDLLKSAQQTMFSKMDAQFPRWRENKKVLKRVKNAAKQSAKNTASALEISELVGESSETVVRWASVLHSVVSYDIDTAFAVIKKKCLKGMAWADVVKWIVSQSIKSGEKVFYNGVSE